jgi:hypothetical protein
VSRLRASRSARGHLRSMQETHPPQEAVAKPDGSLWTTMISRRLHDHLAELDGVDWIDNGAREMVERFMPDLIDKLPDRTTETLDQVIGKSRAAAARKASKPRRRTTQTKSRR